MKILPGQVRPGRITNHSIQPTVVRAEEDGLISD